MMNARNLVSRMRLANAGMDDEVIEFIQMVQSDARTDLQSRATALLERARWAEAQYLELIERAKLLEAEVADIKRTFAIPTGPR